LVFFFKYRGIESFNSPPDLLHQIYNYDIGDCQYLPNNQNPEIDPDGFSRISQCQLGEFYTYASTNGYRHNDAINIYIPHATTDFGGAALNRIMTVTHPWGLTTSTFVHELGHNFGLFHTFGGWIKLNPDGTVDENYTGCEHVTRNPSDSNYNADASGDWVTDTPAIPSFRFEYCYLNGLPESQCTTPPNNFYYYDQLNCEYIGAGDPYYRGDCEGTLYQISPTDARNYMGYNSSGCSDNFTVGQSVRMKDFISTNSQLQAATTTIASLYEPYKGVYLSGINCTDPPLFQPGFEYKFVECHCDCPQPAEYGAFFNSNYNNVLKFVSPYETVFESISHPNHTAISIREIDIANQYAQIQKCWDDSGSIASFGTIIKFNDNVFNTNVTITPQDSTSINNPQLIDNLQPGLYNIIENYENGGTQETVILKENN